MRLAGFAQARSNQEVVIDYLISQEGSVMLNDEQEMLLRRWQAADDIMRELKYRPKEAAQMLATRFGISISIAYKALADAAHVFGTTRKKNKPYLLALQIERIEALVILLERKGKHDILVKLLDTYTNALKLLPDDQEEKKIPSTIIFNVTHNEIKHVSDVELTPAEANEIVAKRMASWGVEIEDVMCEEG